jgi:peptidoglycan hydrolase-like amidase
MLLCGGIWFGFTHIGQAQDVNAPASTSSTPVEVTPSTIDRAPEISALKKQPSASKTMGEMVAESENAVISENYAVANGPAIEAAFASLKASKSRNIRVGLVTKGGPIALLSTGTMLISDGEQVGRRMTVPPGQTATVTFGLLQKLNARGVLYEGPIEIRTAAGRFAAWRLPRLWVSGGVTRISSDGGNPRWARGYRGSFELAPQDYSFEPAKHKSPLRLVNILPLEEYLKGVVPWEMHPSAPLEALKAQSVCARSETLAKIEAGRHRLDGYDICDYDHCQGYSGTENEKPASSLAVEQTAGLVLYYRGRIADAVYATNSGGMTAAKEDVWSGPDVPHLRSVRDFSPARHKDMARVVKPVMTEADWAIYCSQNLSSYAQPSQRQIEELAARLRRSKTGPFREGDMPEFYRWTRVVSARDMATAVSLKMPVREVTEIRVEERAPSGHIKRLAITGKAQDNSTMSIVYEKDAKVRSILSGRLGSTTALPSSTFVVTPRRENGIITQWVFKGAGWGHGAGMCQRGAQSRAREGWTARRLLQHYFAGVEIRQVG